jgi:catechol 2,3-dioxygenase-like lactoylglutathione lyase family enzyme
LGLEFVSHFPEWHHVLFKVKDADASIRFYSEYLGMNAVQDQKDADGKRWVWMRFSENPNAPLFVFVEETQFKGGAVPSQSLQSFSFRMPDLKPVEEMSAKAKNDGHLVEAAAYGGHMKGYFCILADPDGNRLEFNYVLSSKTDK